MLSEWSQNFQPEKLIWIVILSQLYIYCSWQKTINVTLKEHLKNTRQKVFEKKEIQGKYKLTIKNYKIHKKIMHRVKINSNNMNNSSNREHEF